MKNGIITFVILSILIILIPIISNAEEITKNTEILLDGKKIDSKVTDNKESTYIKISYDSKIEIKSEENIYGIYIIYELLSKEGTLVSGKKEISIGKNGFLHEYIDVKKEVGDSKQLTLTYKEDVKIADLYVLGDGNIPDFVEIWQKPCERADLLLDSTHSDDEQLFFLGLLPTYVSRGANVQVIYFTNHNDTPSRLHEQLHGLYTVGIRNYPIIGIVPDAYSTSLDGALANLKKAKISEEDATKFQVEMIRRFKPKVVVGHDEKGEYGHGQHILNTYLLEKAIKLAKDVKYDEESLKKYGAWDVSKMYIHLYEKNQITMNYDIQLEYFNGKTAYEVSKEGYSKHLSQQWTWFTRWINGENNEFKKATEIKDYSPLIYGLYYTNVGDDVEKNDMFENLVFYKDEVKQEEIAQTVKQDSPEKKDDNTELLSDEQNKGNNKFIIICIIIVLLFIWILTLKIRNKKKRKKLKHDYEYRFKNRY